MPVMLDLQIDFLLPFSKPTTRAEILGEMGLGKPLWMGTKATVGTRGQRTSCQHFPAVSSRSSFAPIAATDFHEMELF